MEFSNAIKKGRTNTEMGSLAVIDTAAKSGQWQAAAWRLERAHPERWSTHKREIIEQEKLLKQLTEEIAELRKLIPTVEKKDARNRKD